MEVQRINSIIENVNNHFWDPYNGAFQGNGIIEIIDGRRRYSDPAHRQMYRLEPMGGAFEQLQAEGYNYNMVKSLPDNFQIYKRRSNATLHGIELFDFLFQMLSPNTKLWKYSAYREYRPGHRSVINQYHSTFPFENWSDSTRFWLSLDEDEKTEQEFIKIFGDIYFNHGSCIV